MFKRIRVWLIVKLVGDQPVVMNIDVCLKKKTYDICKPILTINTTLQ